MEQLCGDFDKSLTPRLVDHDPLHLREDASASCRNFVQSQSACDNLVRSIESTTSFDLPSLYIPEAIDACKTNFLARKSDLYPDLLAQRQHEQSEDDKALGVKLEGLMLGTLVFRVLYILW